MASIPSTDLAFKGESKDTDRMTMIFKNQSSLPSRHSPLPYENVGSLSVVTCNMREPGILYASNKKYVHGFVLCHKKQVAETNVSLVLQQLGLISFFMGKMNSAERQFTILKELILALAGKKQVLPILSSGNQRASVVDLEVLPRSHW